MENSIIMGKKTLLARSSSQPFAKKKTVTVLGHQMAYIDEGQGVPVIFVHGDPSSSYLWRNVMPYAEGLGRLIAPDLMGMGDSEKLPVDMGKDRYTFPEQAKYFEALVDQLCPEGKVILVVHDCGSFIGFNWANTHRDRVMGIAYMESLVAPMLLSDFPDNIQEQLKTMTQEKLEESLQHPPFLLEEFLLKSRAFTETEKEYYRAPFKNPGEDRRPLISFQLPVVGINPHIVAMCADYSAWMAENQIPKLFIKANPGYLINGRFYDICRKWNNQTEVEVEGYHYIQETSSDFVGNAIAKFVKTLV